MQPNREFPNVYQGKFFKKQGIGTSRIESTSSAIEGNPRLRRPKDLRRNARPLPAARAFATKPSPPYSAATCDAAMNCDTHFFRRLRFSRYIASNSAGGKECVDGRLSSAAPQALSRGNVSMRPSFFTPSRKK